MSTQNARLFDCDTPTPTMSRIWAMPNARTFSIAPISALLARYIVRRPSAVIVDPFSAESMWATHRNDLNPAYKTRSLHAADYCAELIAEGVTADVVLFDPPYSPRQISEVYKSIGRECTTKDTQNAMLYKSVRDGLNRLLKPNGLAISCGWNSAGFGKERGFTMLEILLVAHGGAHNDTIVVVERKAAPLPPEPDAP